MPEFAQHSTGSLATVTRERDEARDNAETYKVAMCVLSEEVDSLRAQRDRLAELLIEIAEGKVDGTDPWHAQSARMALREAGMLPAHLDTEGGA